MKKIKVVIYSIFFGLIVLSLAFIIFSQNNVFFSNSRPVIVTDFSGKVEVITSNGSKTIDAFKKMRLLQGDRLLTGEKAWVSLKIDSDKEVFVSENTSLIIKDLSGSKNDLITLLTLEAGKVWTNIQEKLNRNSKYEIETPTATMGVRGTKFYVDASTEVSKLVVLEGAVAATTTIMTQDPDGKMKAEQVTLLINKNKQLSIEKDQIITLEELSSKIKDASLSSLDIETLRFIKESPEGIDQEIYNEITEYLEYKNKEVKLIQDGKVQVKGTVFLPNGERNTEGGHIHIRNSKNIWVYFGLLNGNGDFVAGDLSDGSYWLRSDPELVGEDTRSNEVSFVIINGKADYDYLKIHLNTLQVAASIVNPGGLPVTEGYLYVSDSQGNWIYYAEIEKALNTINIGGLPDDSYIIIAYPAANSEFVQSDASSLTIKNGKANLSRISLMFNTPQFSGTVLLADGQTSAPAGHIHVLDEKGNWVQYINLDQNGGYRIGGLKDGKYWLRADSSDDAVSSNELELDIINGKVSIASPRLILNQ